MYISSRVLVQESWYKVAVCIYHQVFISRKVDTKLQYVYIITCSWYKVAVCIYHHVFICSKVDVKLRYVYIIRGSSEGKLIYSCGMYISSRVHLHNNWYKVTVRIYHQVLISRKVNIKLRYLYIIRCSSAG